MATKLTVAELVRLLQQMPQDLEVWMGGSEWSDPVTEATIYDPRDLELLDKSNKPLPVGVVLLD